MLALGNRDVRKALGVNSFSGEGKMEDVELEEGEAYSYNDANTNDEYSDCVNHDFSLSYIDAKIQHVLGHFQKDFGGVSAEKLGVKFDGYGSFLENGERSPNCDTPRSPPPSQLEDGSRNHVTPLSVPPTMKPRFASDLSVYPSGKQAHAHDLVNQERGLPPRRDVEHVNSNEREEIKSVKLIDPRMLKVRIKVSSDKLSTQKKAAIYSGLGLDVSPSQSVDCSPSESDGMSHKPQDAVIESPMSILQIMTSPSVHENLLLSPLQDNLILLNYKETSSEQRMDTSNVDLLSYRASANGSVPLTGRNLKKAFDGTKSEPKIRNGDITDVRSDDVMTTHPRPSVFFQKNMEMDTMDHEEVVSKTLKLPPTSGSGKKVNLKKLTSDVGNQVLGDKDKLLHDPVKKGTKESPGNEDPGPFGKPKGYPRKLSQGKGAKVDGPSRENGSHPGTMQDEFKTHSSSMEGNSTRNAEHPAAIPSEVLDERASYPELDIFPLASQKEKPPSKGKSKLKGCRNDETLGADASRESLSGSSSANKSNKSFQLDNSRPKSEHEDAKLKDPGKSRDKYKEFFGNLDGEEVDEDELIEVAPVGGLQEFTGAGRRLTESLGRVKAGSKKVYKSLKPTVNAPSGQISELDHKHEMDAAPIAPTYVKEVGKYDEISAPVSPAVPPVPAAPVFIEYWVGCEKCQKWRLLPPGKSPDDLPEKWICSMLDWLPGMNRCNVSQEETTRAIMASLQVPLSDAHKSDLNFGMIGADMNSVHQSEVKRTYFGPPSPSSRGKKKSGMKGTSFSNKDGPQFSDSEKKQVQSAKSRSLDDVKTILLRSATDFEQSINHEFLGEKHPHESKTRENYSDGGDLQNSRPQKRKKADQDNHGTPKKVRNELKRQDDEDWISNDSKISRRVVEISPGLLPSLTRQNQESDEEADTKMSKHDSAKIIQLSLKNIRGEGRISVDRQSSDVGRSNDRDMATKKRKPKDPLENQECFEGTTECRQGSTGVLSQDIERQGNKKPRLLKHEGKYPGIRQESSKIHKKEAEQMDQLVDLGSQPSKWGINDADSVQRKARSPMPTTAASSSSKVCSSPKSKSSFREMKGSPAESVSSSPIRSSKRDKRTLVPKTPTEKEEYPYVKVVSPRKFHDGDIIAPTKHFLTDGRDESATAHHVSLRSSMVPEPDEIGFSASAKAKVRHSTDAHSQKSRKDGRDALGPSETEDSDLYLNGGRGGNSHHISQSHSQKSGKAPSSRSRDRSQSSKHEGEREKPKHSFHKLKEAVSLKEPGNGEGKPETRDSVNDDGRGKWSSGKQGRANQTMGNGHECKDEELDVLYGQSDVSHLDNKLREDSAKPQYSKAEQSAERWPSSLPGVVDSIGTDKVNEAEPLVLNIPGKSGGFDPTCGNRQQRPPISNGNSVRETDARSPTRKEYLNIVANKAIKEGADLKHMADRVKDSDSSLNRTALYFQAALKFLHGASLLESSKNDSSKHYDMAQSVQVYGSTAKLCEYCAHEYEKSKDMASAALAYKCMEVAYLKVVYASSSTASRDRVELQVAFKINPAGESPSSSASDLDNVNNSAAVEKSIPKGVSSPYVPGSESIIAQSRNSLIRLFNYSQEVSSAMEASRRSRAAFSASNGRTGDAQYAEGISCIRRALDFNFQDVQGLLRLVRLASEAIDQ